MHDLQAVSSQFQIKGRYVDGQPYGSGHINDTYALVFDQDGHRVRYILQRINHNVFKDTISLMDNIKRVTEHVRGKLLDAGVDDVMGRVLTLIPARDDKCYYQDDSGNTWRMYVFIEGARTYDVIDSPLKAREAAKAFGTFQKMLKDFPEPRLTETIVDFHNTPSRFANLMAAVNADKCNRAAAAKAEIEFACTREPIVATLFDLQQKGELPERVTHNDTKLNNVMIDDKTSEGRCVIDLDTVMPGLVLSDFGDMVRSGTNSAREDCRDLSKVFMRMEIYEALAEGYLSSAGEFLTSTEKDYLAFSAKLITFEIGIRFLADFLQGDVYFKTHRDNQNLDRTRAQFKLMSSMEERESEMRQIIERF